MAGDERRDPRSGDRTARPQDSTVHASEGGGTRETRKLTLGGAAARVGSWNARAARSGEEVGRALRLTLFRRQRRDAGLAMTGVEFPELLESEATPGLVVPDAVLIPETVLRAQGRDRAGGTQGMGNSPKDASGTPSGGDILPPETPRPPTTARRVAAGIVLVAIAVGLGLMLSIALVLAVAWISSSVMDYFQS